MPKKLYRFLVPSDQIQHQAALLPAVSRPHRPAGQLVEASKFQSRVLLLKKTNYRYLGNTMGSDFPPELRENLQRRLQRLEGQVRGVNRMLDEDRDCQDILTQLSAIRGAAHNISLILVENYALHCVRDAGKDQASTNEAISRLVTTLGKLP